MDEPMIKEFFDQRKEAWLKKNLKAGASLEEIAISEQACESTFALAEWLPNAASRAGQISIATHPCTFSHSSARKNKNGTVTSTIAECPRHDDGYLRTGNVAVEPDALGNAAALDVYKFLNVRLQDGLTLLQHISIDTDQARQLLNISTATYAELKAGFMAMVEPASGDVVTSSKIKQVYFPVSDDYHQLSVLTNSGLVFELRQRLDAMRFGDVVKAQRELKKTNQYSDAGYSEIYDITTIGYGGTKPQNISVLNNQNGGKAHLLSSVPPVLNVRKVRFPLSNFFDESLNLWSFKELFEDLHDVMKIELGGNISRQKLLTARDNRIKALVLKIMDIVYLLREASIEQYRESSSLPAAQTVWLCADKIDERENSDLWLDEIIHSCTRWLNNNYSKALGDKQILLGNEEFAEIKNLIAQWVVGNKEFLR
ncbi:MAG: type I-F CRISPR-associated protein Csy1 [Marinagarivorans sp.]|nr:type I-F CRISPR-associated protein Csy1 [Marinagarivorans sp.]